MSRLRCRWKIVCQSRLRGTTTVLFLLLIFSTTLASAQSIDSTQIARFQLAESYFRGAQFDRAIALLEDLHTESPRTYVFFDRLRQAYESVKRYDDAILLIDQHQPKTPALLAEKGRILYLKGDENAATDAWSQAIRLMPASPNTYLAVYRSQMQLRLFEKSISVLELGRETLRRDDLFQTDLAYLYGLIGDHAHAMEEYLRLLEQNARQLGFVRNRLSRYTDQEEALLSSTAVVERAVRVKPMNRVYRELLAWLYLEGGRYREAFSATQALDRLAQAQGNILYNFSQQAADAGAYDVALDAYRVILTRYPTTPIAAEAQEGIGEMYERRAEKNGERVFDDRGNRLGALDYDRALDAYRTFLEAYPTHPQYPDVLRRIGRLQQDVFLDLDEAESTLQEVATRYANTDAAHQAAYDLGRIALQRNRLGDARLAFSRLADRLRTGELADRARYELALIHFYEGEFDATLTLTQALQENTSADVANDAIELKVLVVENKGPDSLNTPLRSYAAARLLERQRRLPEAVDTLDALLEKAGDHALADDTRYLRAVLLRKIGHPAQAVAALLEIPLIFPQSYLADRSLFTAAEILEQELQDSAAAVKTYTRLLIEFPGSLLIPDARARIRILRGDDA